MFRTTTRSARARRQVRDIPHCRAATRRLAIVARANQSQERNSTHLEPARLVVLVDPRACIDRLIERFFPLLPPTDPPQFERSSSTSRRFEARAQPEWAKARKEYVMMNVTSVCESARRRRPADRT